MWAAVGVVGWPRAGHQKISFIFKSQCGQEHVSMDAWPRANSTASCSDGQELPPHSELNTHTK